MARKLKTYQTSLGFFDQAIAAPSMKAALEAWGADSNLFHQGAARESDDPDVIAATMARPGVVLRRPVGSNGPFGEHADLPIDLGRNGKPKKAASKRASKVASKGASKANGHKAKKARGRSIDEVAEKKAALAYEREQARRERDRAKAEAARQKEIDRRREAVAEAQKALDEGQQKHATRAGALQAELEDLEKKVRAEEGRWEKEEARLEAALRRARG